jgi:hypothetical protein
VLVRAKAAGDPVDLRSYAFTTDSGWLRRLVFGVMEGWSDAKRRKFSVASGGGYSAPTDAQHGKAVGANLILNIGRSQGWPYVSDWWPEEQKTSTLTDWVTTTLSELEHQVSV